MVGYDHGAGGGSDPTAIEIGSYAPDGTLYWWHELYDTEVLPVRARASLLRVMLHGREPMAIVRGHEAKQIGKELLDEGFVTTFPKDGGPEARILRMSELMGTKKFKILRGRCPHLKRELLSQLQAEPSHGIDFFEVAPENWVGLGGARAKQFDWFAERYPITWAAGDEPIGRPVG